MTGFDLRSFNLMTGMMSMALGIVLLGVRRHFPASIRGLLLWGLAPLVCAVASVFYGLEGWLPAVVVALGGNGLVFAGNALLYFGSQRFYGMPSSWRLWAVVGAACLLSMLFFQLVYVDYRVRLILFCLGMSSLLLVHARLLLQQGASFPTRFTAMVLIAQATVMLLRALASFWIDTPITPRFASSPIHTIYIGAFGLALLLLVVGVQLMASERVRAEFEHLATHDDLTQTLNRRAILAAGEAELQRWHRYGQPFALLLLDIDLFKRINDTHGHPVGDQVLQRFVEVLRPMLRGPDRLARYGGEEFFVLMPATDQAAALAVAERLRLAIEQQIATPSLPACTASIGLACAQAGDETLAALIARADAALYRAKAQGRNRVEAG